VWYGAAPSKGHDSAIETGRWEPIKAPERIPGGTQKSPSTGTWKPPYERESSL
jgi:hypothetical protein